MTTLTAGNSASFSIGPYETLTIRTGGRGSLSFTSLAENAHPSFTANVANGDYGPYGVAMQVLMTMIEGSAEYEHSGSDAGNLVTAETNPLTGGIVLSAGGVAVATSPVIGQTGIPMIVPSSGSIGNNGALSGMTALPAVYTACYMYFPASAIVASSLAGMYYVVMSSNTAGTIYNNAYTSGTPTIPASPTAFVTTGPGAYTQTTSAVEVLSYTVPANAMGVNVRLEVRGRMSCPNNANSKSCVAAFADVSTLTFINNGVTTNLGVEFGNTIQNRGSAAVQVANATSFGNLGQTGTAALRGTVDTTLAQPMRFKLVVAVATDYALIEHLSLDCFPA